MRDALWDSLMFIITIAVYLLATAWGSIKTITGDHAS